MQWTVEIEDSVIFESKQRASDMDGVDRVVVSALERGRVQAREIT